MTLFLLGATTMAAAVAGLVFLRMWRESRDRLYAAFAAAFWLEALGRVGLLWAPDAGQADVSRYAVRIIAYGVIILAIVDKNVRR